jgi:hypothetical protein
MGLEGRKEDCGSFHCILDWNFYEIPLLECVCDSREKGAEYGNKLYFYFYNGKWLMDLQVSC